MSKVKITEAMKVHDEWYKEAEGMTLEKLPEFLKKLSSEYSHDYGTICHAIAAAAIASAWAMDKGEQGGITGFQAGAIMWEFIRHWSYTNNKCGLKILDYDNFLYPQYSYKFQKTIDKDTWKAIQQEARNKINEADMAYKKYLEEVEQYKIDFAKFVEKYPDYHERPEHYEHLGCGTGTQWEEYHVKRGSGFEFAPKKPYDPRPSKSVYEHWTLIVNGKVPFGYVISDD